MGILFTNLLTPLLVTEPDDVPRVILIYGLPALPLLVATLLVVTSSAPPTPPAASSVVSQERSHSFWRGSLAAIRFPAFIVSFIGFGVVQGVAATIVTLLSQIMCPRGYSDEFTGSTIATLNVCGLVGAAVISAFVDKTKLYLETIKVCFSLTVLCFVGVSIFLLFPNMQGFIIVIQALIGITIFPLWPLYLELGVECTFQDVSEVTSNTLLLMGGQVFGIAFITLGPYLATPLTPDELALSVCNSNPLDYKFFLMTLSIVLTGSVLLTILTLHTKYKRLLYDREEKQRLSHVTLSSQGIQSITGSSQASIGVVGGRQGSPSSALPIN